MGGPRNLATIRRDNCYRSYFRKYFAVAGAVGYIQCRREALVSTAAESRLTPDGVMESDKARHDVRLTQDRIGAAWGSAPWPCSGLAETTGDESIRATGSQGPRFAGPRYRYAINATDPQYRRVDVPSASGEVCLDGAPALVWCRIPIAHDNAHTLADHLLGATAVSWLASTEYDGTERKLRRDSCQFVFRDANYAAVDCSDRDLRNAYNMRAETGLK